MRDVGFEGAENISAEQMAEKEIEGLTTVREAFTVATQEMETKFCPMRPSMYGLRSSMA